jgi:OOP family OmpA-OmpF porin
MKIKSAVSALVIALPALVTTAAVADNAAGGKFYAGGGLGTSNFKADCSGSISCSNPKLNFKLLAGYQFMPNFALEGGYMHLGRIKIRGDGFNASERLSSFTLSGLGIVPLSKEAQLFGKLGAHFSHMKSKASYQGPEGSFSESDKFRKTGLLLGAGLQYDLTQNLTGRIEFERLNFGGGSSSKTNLNTFTASMMYSF